MPDEFEPFELSDDEWDEALGVCLAMATTGGFSKGTANVSADDVKKLRPLMKHYAKMAHPFRACVRDNRKRFGPLTEKYCAVLKDLIRGTTSWRSTERKKNLSEMTPEETAAYAVELPKEFFEWLSETSVEEVEQIVTELRAAEDEPESKQEQEEALLAECFLAEVDWLNLEAPDAEGLIWKPVMREGKWKYSPGPGQKPVAKPLTVIAAGQSDPVKLIVSLEELAKNFDLNAVEHVTIPTSHDDKVYENTGYIKKVRLGKDDEGRVTLEAGHDFTEPDIKGKVLRKSIANTSAGVLFDYIRKEDGSKFGAVLQHVALTNHPWLNGMKPFGMSDGDKVEVLSFSEEDAAESVDLDGSKPYGDVPYADPGYQKDKKKRYPLDSEEHCRAAWSYINQGDNAAKYTSMQLSAVKTRIKSALKKYRVNVKTSEEILFTNTNKAWLHEHPQALVFLAELQKGGVLMADNETPTPEEVIAEKFGLSEDEVTAKLKLADDLEKKNRTAGIDSKVKEWEDAKKSPAIVKVAKAALLADTGQVVLTLSEDGSEKKMTVADVVESLVAASPEVKLDEEQTEGEKGATEGERPATDTKEENEVQFSAEEKRLAVGLFLSGECKTEEDALAEAKKRIAASESK